ncbi:MAG: biotin synthase, partial [Pseudomonadota bacterium]
MDQLAPDVITISQSRWSIPQIEALLDLPFSDLIHRAQLVHRQHHDANAVQLSTL